MCENVIVWLEKKRYIIVTVNMSKEKEIVRHIGKEEIERRM